MCKSRQKDAICAIYQIYNTVNGKVYIGKAVDVFKRKVEHFKDLENNKHYNKHLQSSFNKYGKECFKFQIVEECNEECLIEQEIYNIECFNSFHTGYNKTLGGEGMLGRKWNDDQYKIMSEKMKGNCYGLGNKSNLGLKKSEESKEKVRQSLLGRKRGKYNIKKK
jgi:group I intron endonuclease